MHNKTASPGYRWVKIDKNTMVEVREELTDEEVIEKFANRTGGKDWQLGYFDYGKPVSHGRLRAAAR